MCMHIIYTQSEKSIETAGRASSWFRCFEQLYSELHMDSIGPYSGPVLAV